MDIGTLLYPPPPRSPSFISARNHLHICLLLHVPPLCWIKWGSPPTQVNPCMYTQPLALDLRLRQWLAYASSHVGWCHVGLWSRKEGETCLWKFICELIPRNSHECSSLHHITGISFPFKSYFSSTSLVIYHTVQKSWNGKERKRKDNQSVRKPPTSIHSQISTSCSPIKLNLVTCSWAPHKLEEINSNANEKAHNLLSAEECMLH